MLGTIRNRTFAHSPFAALDEVMKLVTREVADGECCGGKTSAALAVDIREHSDEFVVEASVPGFRKDEIDVQLHDGLLSITATRAAACQDESKEGTWLRRERRSTGFARQVRLPDGITSDGIRAELADGVLTLRIPKPAQPQPRKIAIN